MRSVGGAPVIVGVDGSLEALRAVRLAAEEAARRRRPLRVLHALGWPLHQTPVRPQASGPLDGGPRFQAERILAQAIAEARQTAPDIPVNGEIADGQPATILVNRSPYAALIVLGHRGLGGFASLLLGSVAVQVSAHAHCPVLIARGVDRQGAPVAVGIDGSRLSALAIEFAVEEAARRGSELIAVHAYQLPDGDVTNLPPSTSEADQSHGEHERILTEATAQWRSQYPDLRIVHRPVRRRPAAALIEESNHAGLVVVGARGRGGFAGLVTGSVSHAVLHHAACPVAVVRRGPQIPPESADRPPVPGQSPAPGS